MAELLAEGWDVIISSRHRVEITPASEQPEPSRPGAAARSALPPPGHWPTRESSRRTSRWVRADWTEPDLFASAVADALDGPAHLLVAWVHEPYRTAVLRAVAPLLDAATPVVEVYSSFAATPATGLPDPALTDHPTHRVVLGFVHTGSNRVPTHQEISAGVLAVIRRALGGEPPRVHEIGRPQP
ncbi:hypothetical protein GCM10012275_46760 [Longimycelium tulufanense]|uniref:Uncharacterized protein n=1 Tax=Longimycelium tulufanense TaxID=907463 RepID=A0A8J3FXT3_9PSEU|nr:hypothetical protein GCM10012275_46760 [Longimycelium tulufanense]